MICCLNPTCQQPLNQKGTKICKSCGTKLEPLLRNRYRVIKPIGQGGFARTYLAADEDMLNASCVIKQFSLQAQGTKSQEKAIDLFNQEAYRLHELGVHPQIPTLLAYFEQDKRLYLVQQYIEGQNLYQELQRQGPFNEGKIREVLLDILPVLKFIHDRQVIHRDITPTNIIRRQIDGKLVLIDFGIAKQLTETSQIQPGTKIGTEGFAPLEQLRNGQVFPASDVYSLGATCVYLLTQAKPDSLYNPLDGRWIWQEYLANKGVVVGDRLAYIINKMLKDWVKERYQSADAVLQDLNSDLWQHPPNRTTPVKPVTGTPIAPPISKQPLSQANISVRPVSQPQVSQPQVSKPQVPRPSFFKPPISQAAFSSPPKTNSPNRIWRCVYTLSGHTSWVMSVAISPNKQVLASGGLDDKIRIWSLQTGALLNEISGHSKPINAVAISPDALLLVSGSDDEKVKIWNLHSGVLIQTLTEHSRDVKAVAISPDGQILASGGSDRTIKLWKLKNGLPIRTPFAPGGMIKTVAIDPKGVLLATGGLDNQIKVWKIANGQLVHTLNGHNNSIFSVTFSPDGQMLATASKDKTIKLWNLQNGELIRTFSGHSAPINSVVVSPDGQTIFSGSNDNTIKIWRLNTGELLFTLKEHSSAINCLAISQDGQLLASASSDKTIKIWQGFG